VLAGAARLPLWLEDWEDDEDPVAALATAVPAVVAEELALVLAAASPPNVAVPRTARAAMARVARETVRTCASRRCDLKRGRSSSGSLIGAFRRRCGAELVRGLGAHDRG
jgi:hypothetical protein